MVDQVSTLGIKVDSTDVAKAGKELDTLAVKSEKAERATDGLATSSEKTGKSLDKQSKKTKTTARATDELSSSEKRNTTSANSMARATDKLAVSSQNATNSLDKQNRKVKTATSEVDELTASEKRNAKASQLMANAFNQMKIAFIAFIGIQGARKLKDLTDEATSINNRLRQVTTTTNELNSTFSRLLSISNETRSSLSSTSVLYQRLSIASEELSLSSDELFRITSTINKSFAVSGATAQETAGAIRQLSQGLAAGALRGDEFNSVAEQAPAIMRAIATETNKTIGELREFAATGGITAEIVISALQNVEDEIDKKFSKSIATFDQKITIIENNLIAWAGENEDLVITLSAIGDGLGFAATVLTAFLDVIFMVTSGIIQLVGFIGDLASEFGFVNAAVEAGNKPISEFIDFQKLILETLGFVNKVLLTTAQIVSTPFVAAFLAAKNAVAFLINAEIDLITIATDFIGINNDFTRNLASSKIPIVNITNAMAKFHDQFSLGRESIDSVTKEMVDNLKATKKLEKAIKDIDNASAKLARAQAKLQKSTDKVVKELQEELDALMRTDREQSLYEALKEAGVEANTKFAASIREVNDALFDEIDALEAAKKATKELEKQAEASAKAQQKAYEDAFDFTSDLFEDTINNWEDGWRGFADNVVDIIKKMLARIVAEYLASGVLQLLGITGVGGGGGFSGGGGGGGFGAAFTQAGTSFVASEAISAAATQFGFGATTGGAVAGGAQAGLTVDLGTTASEFALGADTFGTALNTYGPALSALGGAIEGFNNSGTKGAVAGAAGGYFGFTGGAIVGAEIGSTFGPYGALIGGAIGGIIGGIGGAKLGASVFGTPFQSQRSGLDLNVTGGEIGGQFFDVQKAKGGLFKSTRRRTVFEDIDTEILDDFNLAISSTQSQIVEAFGALGFDLANDVFDSFSTATVRIQTSGKTDEEVAIAITEYFNNVSDQMVASIGELEGITFERLGQLATALTLANDQLSLIGASTLSTNVEGAINAEFLITTAGGLEAFIAATSKFEQFFTGRDAFEFATDQFEGLLDSFNLGLALPETREGFADLVTGLELFNDSQALAFNTLTALSSEFDSFYSEVERLEAERHEQELRAAEEELRLAEQLAEEMARLRRDESDTAFAILKKSLQAERELINEEISSTAGFIKQLADASRDIGKTLGAGNADLSVAQAQAVIKVATEAARTGNFETIGSIGPALQTLSKISETDFANVVDFRRTQSTTQQALEELQALTDAELSVQETVLMVLQDELISLNDIETNLTEMLEVQRGTFIATLSVAESMDNFLTALGIETAAVPGFANGGQFGGGLRLVGERGPELEMTGSSRIMSNRDLMSMLSDNANNPQMQQLINEVHRIGVAGIATSRQIRKLLDRWDGDGLPPERAVS